MFSLQFSGSLRRACTVAAVSTIVLFSTGCGLVEKDFGALVSSIHSTAEGVTGVKTDEEGKVVAVCCTTACMEAKSAEELGKQFKSKFLDALIQQVSDPQKQTKLLNAITFVEKPVELCDKSPVIEIVATRTLPNNLGKREIARTNIAFSDLTGGKLSDTKEKEVQDVTAKFASEFATFPTDTKITFTIPTCPEVPALPPVSTGDCEDPLLQYVATMILEEGGGLEMLLGSGEGEYPACSDCEPDPVTEREYPLNEDAFDFLKKAVEKAANKINR